ncbi:hypothetical protein EVAR_8173_1 [Eumeta japonica]|uniref:Uncharacterized protein n=1 Tax=Eumeta variegata TaxID=151549 RepID=A0A4C1TGH9_EUMVA|nr:hypothetical protein EVAR_8173_1 [Eumeta japonica]
MFGRRASSGSSGSRVEDYVLCDTRRRLALKLTNRAAELLLSGKQFIVRITLSYIEITPMRRRGEMDSPRELSKYSILGVIIMQRDNVARLREMEVTLKSKATGKNFVEEKSRPLLGRRCTFYF